MSNFDKCLPIILKHEGGFSNIRSDPGNWTGGRVGVGELRGTNYGIASHAHPHLDIKNLTVQQAGVIYREQYWVPVKGDELPIGVDLAVFDFGVNSGPRRAAMALQRAVGVADDGAIGPITLAAVKRKSPEDIISRICSDRLSFMRRLSTWPTFGRGWQRRVEGVEREAIRMAMDAALHTVTAPAPVIPRTYPPLAVEPAPAAPVSGWAALFKAIARIFGGKS
jgi:lysozyme family protein